MLKFLPLLGLALLFFAYDVKSKDACQANNPECSPLHGKKCGSSTLVCVGCTCQACQAENDKCGFYHCCDGLLCIQGKCYSKCPEIKKGAYGCPEAGCCEGGSECFHNRCIVQVKETEACDPDKGSICPEQFECHEKKCEKCLSKGSQCKKGQKDRKCCSATPGSMIGFKNSGGAKHGCNEKGHCFCSVAGFLCHKDGDCCDASHKCQNEYTPGMFDIPGMNRTVCKK